jgi:endonuclease I
MVTPGATNARRKTIKRWKVAASLLLAPAVAFSQSTGYYDTADDSSPEALRTSLHEIIDDHTRIPYTSSDTDTWDVLEQADQDRENSQRIVTLYRNASFAKIGGGVGPYNREHTWPKSYGYPVDDYDDPDDNLPYTDMHALFLSDADYNYHRSNSPYNNCDASCIEYPTEPNNGRGGEGGPYPGDSNWQTGEYTEGRWEVWKGRRGDVARALMYMDLRYEGGNHGPSGEPEPDLILTDDLQLIRDSYTQENRDIGYMGMLSVLLDWHRQDPVDTAEVQHHETVAAYQGNRNPFVDHPEWAECIFAGNCRSLEINAGLNDAWFNPDTNGQGFLVAVFPEIRYMFVAWFTFDSERPPEDVAAVIGAPDQRWLTAQGPYSGDTAELDVFVSRGGVFDQADPPVEEPLENVGSMKLHFAGCNAGTVVYDLPAEGLSGAVPIQRAALDNVALCEALGYPAEGDSGTASAPKKE